MPDTFSESQSSWIDLSNYRAPNYQGRGLVVRILWYAVSVVVFQTCLFPFGRLKLLLLRLFGAKLGAGVVVKPQVKIKFPWRLTVGEHAWIGEGAWIDNLADVTIGSHVCLSQEVYLCTGSHDYRSRGFELVTQPIVIGDGAWIAARATVLPGTTIGPNAIITAGSVARGEVEAAAIMGGNPAVWIASREAPAR